MPSRFVVGVHSETDPDIFGMRLGLFTGEAFRDTDVAMGHEGVYLTRSEVLEGFVFHKGVHVGGAEWEKYGMVVGVVKGLTSEKQCKC